MMRYEIVPFHEGLLPAAGELLAARHVRDRIALPLLPQRFEETRKALAAVREVWHRPWTSGMAAMTGGRMVAYLMGEARFETLRGRHVWIHLPGHARAEDVAAAVYADLYASAGPAWLDLGAFDHYVQMPAADSDGLDAWYGLSFGREQAHGLRSLAEPLPEAREMAGIVVRRAVETDRDLLVEELSPLLRRHMTGPPVWGVALPESVGFMRESFSEMLDDDHIHVWLAVEKDDAGGERVLGYQAYYPGTPADDDLTIPLSDRAVVLQLAATRGEARGRGIGRALARAGLADAIDNGYKMCVADWRTTNIEANRFWPQLGFVPAVYRLIRKVDRRIAWATF